MRPSVTNNDPSELALRALVWTLAEPERALRLLDVTGLTPSDLRARASDPAVLSATLAFLLAHEPDLIACADGLDVRPEDLARAHAALDGPTDTGDYA
ncbi:MULTISPECIES: DUF3572 domain-containing protein [unclassified Sphingomonas]|uniref:DUF3572 domain-containing protein n=1 Tax=unclassified Sphingomonas TaxID=196159 RepID=UPI000287AEAF|nr:MULTISPECIES: DUF3572 domain-containing protein [unclassified Sphingomonas]